LNNQMKKLILLLLFIPLVSFSQTALGDFKIVDGEIVWQKVYKEKLEIESQDITLKATGLPKLTTTIWLQNMEGAKLIAEHKDGRTRVTIKDIYSIDGASYEVYNVSTNPNKPTYAHEIYVKNRKGVFKNIFLKKDGKLLNDIIIKEIKNLTNPTGDDW
tara:strand:+ start:600 stop:1076 length:477 start_codon:yes stop_codon:yes gene_type:complete